MKTGQKRHKKIAGLPAVFGRSGRFSREYVQNSRPPQALENQK
jgi:hypothetical protein